MVKYPSSFILANCWSMTEVSLDAGWLDQGSALSSFRQNLAKRAVISEKLAMQGYERGQRRGNAKSQIMHLLFRLAPQLQSVITLPLSHLGQ